MARRGYKDGFKKFLQDKYSWITDDVFDSFTNQGFIFKDSYKDGLFSPGYIDWAVSDSFADWLAWQDEYYKMIEQYRGTAQFDLLYNNPYLSYQNGLDASSIRDRQNKALQYRADIAGGIVENQYNSTQQQVSRDRQAGFNDALTGQVASNTPAAGTVAPEATPMSGPSPDAQLAADVQERQNSFGRVMSAITAPLQFLQTLGSTFDMFTRLQAVGPSIQKIFSDIALQDAQQEALANNNKASWKSQFADVLLGGLDLSSGVVNIKDRLSQIDKSTWSPEQSAYFDELNNSGYFVDYKGNATASMLQDYSSRFAKTASNMAAGSQAAGTVGGVQNVVNPVAAAAHFYDKYTAYGLRMQRLAEVGKDLDNQLTKANRDYSLAQAALARQQEATSAQQEDLLVSETQKSQNEAEIAKLQLAVEQAGQRAKLLEQKKREHEAHMAQVKAEGRDALYEYLDKADPIVRACGMYAMSFIDGIVEGVRNFQDDSIFTGLLGKLMPGD